jgi:hypothetical protein
MLLHALFITGLVIVGLIVLFFLYVFIIALKETIKEVRTPKDVGFEAGQTFHGELGVKLIKKGQPIPQ